MKNEDLIQALASMRHLEPRADALHSVRSRVFSAIEFTPVVSPIQPTRGMNIFSRTMLTTVSAAFAFVLVLANQLPMHGTYQDSIHAIVQAEKLADTLETSSSPAVTAAELKTVTEKARATLDTLKLKGQFGVYTQEQCVQAYVIYYAYLDHLSTYLDTQLQNVHDSATQASFADLRTYVEDSKSEAQRRIHMYPERP